MLFFGLIFGQLGGSIPGQGIDLAAFLPSKIAFEPIFHTGLPQGEDRSADEVVKTADHSQAKPGEHTPRFETPFAVDPDPEQSRDRYRGTQLEAQARVTKPGRSWSSTVRHTPPRSDGAYCAR